MTLKIAYVNTWGGFNSDDVFFSRILKQVDKNCIFTEGIQDLNYDLVISLMPNKVNGIEKIDMKSIKCKKLCFTGESYSMLDHTPHSDAYIGFDHVEDISPAIKYLRFPLYAVYHYDYLNKFNCSSFEELRNKFYVKNPDTLFSAVVSNPSNRLRTELIYYLVTNNLCKSGGAVINNVGNIGWSSDSKHKLTSSCMYNLAFENVSKKGYITEKIYEAFMAGVIPYYWGAPDVSMEFNPESYFVFHSTDEQDTKNSIQLMVERLSNIDLFGQMRQTDPFTGFNSEKYIKNGIEIVKNFMLEILETK